MVLKSDSETAGTLHVYEILILETSFRRQSFRISAWLSVGLASLCVCPLQFCIANFSQPRFYVHKINFWLVLTFLWATKNAWIILEENLGKRRRARRISVDNIKIHFTSARGA